ncbi:putative sulfite oxidase [Phytophthora citrophthora]|uniref:Sulfite oxidase n=1 Tax=Phytophthora citrophthora TaxID=4793 RepID=A0AAD9G0E0_9STRA|nr:putative sulfite oxidase [Phytophthora citrophthora]
MSRYPLRRWALLTLATGTATLAVFAVREDDSTVKSGELKPELPMFSMQQVQQSSRSWVVFRHGVYDVTDFARDHPGGTKILQATGKSVEIFWQQSEPHSRAEVPETLEELRVGNLTLEDYDKMQDVKSNQDIGSAALQRFFFIEGTLSTPDVDLNTFQLTICDDSEVSLSLVDLKTLFKQQTVTTAIRCSTPRGDGGKTVTRVPAEWTGVLLADVLAIVGIATEEGIGHVRFEALDVDKQGRKFGASIPAATALDREVGVLLAYEMNGAPIPKEHGFPLRVIVPGTTGARNVKFVHRIIISRD